MGKDKKRRKIRIIVTNTKCKLDIPLKDLLEIREDTEFRIRVKGAYYSPSYHKRRYDGERVWDGFKRYITEAGYFEGGLLPKVYAYFKRKSRMIRFIDNRELIEPEEIIDRVGDKELRGYQNEAYSAFFNHKVGKLPFQRGILDEATNAGKNLLAAAIFLSYQEDKVFFFLIHDKLIHQQAVEDITALLGKKEVGIIDSKRMFLSRFNICMTPTLASRVKDPKIKSILAKADGCIVDECHRAATKQYQSVLNQLYNCSIKIGMSGTTFMHKDKNKRLAVESFFGTAIHTVKNKRLIEEGYSTKPKVKIVLGETRYKMQGNYKEEYDKIIIKNRSRHRKVWRRIQRAVDKKRYPILLFCKYIDHTKRLIEEMPEELKAMKWTVVHSDIKSKTRLSRLNGFKNGKYDILIATHLIQAGHNMPLIKYSLNAGGADSQIVIIQWVGRNLRKHKSKKHVYIEDMYDKGYYIGRHSKHRVKYYKSEGFDVKEMYKEQARKRSIKL